MLRAELGQSWVLGGLCFRLCPPAEKVLCWLVGFFFFFFCIFLSFSSTHRVKFDVRNGP